MSALIGLIGLLLPAASPLEVKVEERLGAAIPPDLVLVDHHGEAFRFADVVRGRPAILVPAYYRCPMLCGMVLGGVARTIGKLEARVGRDFDIVTVSFDPDEGPADAGKRRASVLPSLPAAEPGGWPFFVGDERSIALLLSSIGLTVVKDPASGQWSHPAVFLVLTPEGRISRYLYGFDIPPADLDLALVEAARGESGESFAKLLLRCFSYDPSMRRYGVAMATAFRAGGVVILLTVLGMVGLFFAKERRRRTS